MEKDLRIYLPHGMFQNTSPERSRIMRAVKGYNNKTTEIKFRLGLVRVGIKNWQVRPKNFQGNPDFLFPEAKLAIFVDGCFWHGCPVCCRIPKNNTAFWEAKFKRNQAKDQRITSDLIGKGYMVIRFWEHEIKNRLSECIEQVNNALKMTNFH